MRLHALAVTTFITLVSWAHASEGVVRASCTEGSRVVYKEDLPPDVSEERRLQIIARNPSAMCVFVEVPKTGRPERNAEAPASGTLPSILPDALIAAASGKTIDTDADLRAALLAISSGSGGQGETYALPQGPIPISRPQAHGLSPGASNGSLGLAIGIYKEVPIQVVMEHWRQIASGSRLLARMTPTISTAEGVTMLSIEGVADEEADGLCQEVREKGMDCIAAF